MVVGPSDNDHKYRRRKLLTLGSAVALGGLAGCVGDDDEDSDGSPVNGDESSGNGGGSDNGDDDTMLIGFANKTLGVPFFARQEDGFHQAVETDLADHPSHLEASEIEGAGIEVPSLDGSTFNAEMSESSQIDQLETFLSRDPDAVIINPVSPTGANPALEEYREEDIPVINIDTEITEFEPDTYIASRNIELGRRAGELLLEFLDDAYDKSSYNVVELQGAAGDVGTRERHSGFREALEDSSVDVIGDEHADWAAQQALDAMEDMITRHGEDIDGVYAHNDFMAEGAYQALEGSDMGPLPTTSIDGSELWVTKFDEYEYYGSIAQQPENMTRLGIEKALMVANDIDIQDYYPIPGIRVTSENAEDYLAEFFPDAEM
ncbi:substrate-binding domain-containing protein [Natrarchaeobius chitinivorans]|nr:substrate-binding domain-containing protein [Natrarchaeobius chitinivorans]